MREISEAFELTFCSKGEGRAAMPFGGRGYALWAGPRSAFCEAWRLTWELHCRINPIAYRPVQRSAVFEPTEDNDAWLPVVMSPTRQDTHVLPDDMAEMEKVS